MIVENEPFLIEYNVRMGDPECQTILPKLKTDLLDIFEASCDGTLDKINIEWIDKKSICVVVCSNGYPEKYETNIEIKGLDKVIQNENNLLFHAGTIKKNDIVYANGGRVLNFVSLANDFVSAKKNILYFKFFFIM